MRKRLHAFSEFSRTILPHEISYLLRSNQLQDEDRLRILEQIDRNTRQHPPGDTFDLGIDKRTYSHLKNWVVRQLAAIDVDQFYQWLTGIDMEIVNDSISPEQERKLLARVRNYAHPHFYFTKFFEVLRNYSNFLLIRLRYEDHQSVSEFLDRYQSVYDRHQEIQVRLQQASADIVGKYSSRNAGDPTWRDWLSGVFDDEGVQGYFRHQALIRLHYLDLRSEDTEALLRKYEQLDGLFREGKFYSKRLLINFYHNMMLLYHKSRDFDQALNFGYLSTRVKNHDYLLYVNNLCDVLVQLGHYQDGLKLLRGAAKEAKQTNNFFNRTGFVSLYMRCQIGVGDLKAAISYGSSFLAVYRKEILKFRWYRFFRTYLEALLRQGQYREIIGTVRKNKLIDLHRSSPRGDELSGLEVIFHLARSAAGEISEEELRLELEVAGKENITLLLQGKYDLLDQSVS